MRYFPELQVDLLFGASMPVREAESRDRTNYHGSELYKCKVLLTEQLQTHLLR